YSLYGGLSAVAWTDIIQVVFLVLGGLVTTYLALDTVSGGAGMVEGLRTIFESAPGHFEMILDKDNPEYTDLPGIAVLVGGMWVANLYYWGFNQYIIQRTLAAKSLRESQNGILFAAFLKLIVPLIVVIPGVVAYQQIMVVEGGANPINNDQAFPWLVERFLTADGLKGLVLAALTAAIVSSLASMLNSTATIFTMDLYKPVFNPTASEAKIVSVGRITAAVALVLAIFLAPLLGGIDQAFQYIQEYTGLVSPGILAIFMLGL